MGSDNSPIKFTRCHYLFLIVNILTYLLTYLKWDQTVLRLDGGNGLDDGGLSMGGCCEGAKGIS